jgi:hypothetical protein
MTQALYAHMNNKRKKINKKIKPKAFTEGKEELILNFLCAPLKIELETYTF